MRVVWNEQTKRPFLALDEGALEALAIREERSSWRNLRRLELAFVFTLTGLGLFAIWDTVSTARDWFQLGEAAVFFILSAWVWWRRQRREKEQRDVGSGVLGDVKRAILNQRQTMQRGLDFMSIMSLVVLGSATLHTVSHQDFENAWRRLAVVGSMTVGLMGVYFLERHFSHGPRLRNLESLRDRLVALPE